MCSCSLKQAERTGPHSNSCGAVVFVIVATARFRAHPFLVLLVAAYLVGLAAGLPGTAVVAAITEGFGGTIGYIGIVIAAGTIIGALLEKTGGAALMARSVLRWIGKARSLLAMSITGLFVSIPVFCDSGFVVLAPLNRSLAKQSGTSLASFTVALSMGLYAGHVFIPPTPGPLAAAGELGADIGLVMLLGFAVSVPVIAATWLFAQVAGRRIVIEGENDPEQVGEVSGSAPPAADTSGDTQLRSAWLAFLPILLPVVLIAAQSVASLPGRPFGKAPCLRCSGLSGIPIRRCSSGWLRPVRRYGARAGAYAWNGYRKRSERAA